MKPTLHQPCSADEILALGRTYQGAAVLAAAAELDLFSALAPAPLPAGELARALQCDLRALTISTMLGFLGNPLPRIEL
ncbi:MAG: hypothetical protein WCQ21_25480 [Verrucomicrobiota bacterium]